MNFTAHFLSLSRKVCGFLRPNIVLMNSKLIGRARLELESQKSMRVLVMMEAGMIRKLCAAAADTS